MTKGARDLSHLLVDEQQVAPCRAPSAHLRFETSGLVFVCCQNSMPVGSTHTQSLREIWSGAVRRAQAEAMERSDFSMGCQSCAHEISIGGRESAYLSTFDGLTPDGAGWPRRIELNLSNACNLQCVQCDGESSSAIRIHREGRPLQPDAYGDGFFDDLASFLPHLDEIMFGGGEPFLQRPAYRAWDLMAEVSPRLACTIVTNATQWNARVERVLATLQVRPVISIDAVRRETFEAIRVGASHAAVVENAKRFIDYARGAGRPASMNFCLMPQNLPEFGEFLLWADELDVAVDVLTVWTPASHSVMRSEPDELRAMAATLDAQDDEMCRTLGRNREVWVAERDRLRGWARAAASSATTHRSPSQTIRDFPRAGRGPVDDADARADLRQFSDDGTIFEFRLGPDDLIAEISANLAPARAQLVGRRLETLADFFAARLGGPLTDSRVTEATEDRLTADIEFPLATLRTVSTALRGADGWADAVSLLAAVRLHSSAVADASGTDGERPATGPSS